MWVFLSLPFSEPRSWGMSRWRLYSIQLGVGMAPNVACQGRWNCLPTSIVTPDFFFLAESVLVPDPEQEVSCTKGRLSRDKPRLYLP